MEIEGRPRKFLRHGMFAGLSAMGERRDIRRAGQPLEYGETVPFGAMDPKERLERIDAEGLKAAFLYPTLSLLYEAETTDPEMAQAYTRAYNRYIVDFCKGSGGRLIPDRAPVARRSASRGARARTRGQRRMQGWMGLPIRDDAQAARASRS